MSDKFDASARRDLIRQLTKCSQTKPPKLTQNELRQKVGAVPSLTLEAVLTAIERYRRMASEDVTRLMLPIGE